MTRVEFVKIKRPEKAKHLCELAEHFFTQGQRVLVMVCDDNQGVTLDRFMWTWKKGAFIPHVYDNGAVDCLDEPVIIEVEERNPNNAGVLIMGKPCSLDFIRQFDLVIDFAELYEPQLKVAARKRYAHFRETGFEVAMR
ncbi:DNA polymerase III, chi subunit [Syntrophotalea carbinolica DSM 2380]|uniref:DNA polymerase III, chi subunit n=1 Tax=Syntrophotalea carbinolica (strain DSM 2380 / NBRC 103641 / GraBd1) TaxID=338963 RepID=Q3A4B4_SYNC1|nr:DNA polymerase III subunit chi [Syntrophotalea carbinolica]ABA88793.1 DNA polymerase III, chi subunit [Syntrophotalea carbinolica DSM 2380]